MSYLHLSPHGIGPILKKKKIKKIYKYTHNFPNNTEKNIQAEMCTCILYKIITSSAQAPCYFSRWTPAPLKEQFGKLMGRNLKYSLRLEGILISCTCTPQLSAEKLPSEVSRGKREKASEHSVQAEAFLQPRGAGNSLKIHTA